MLKLDYLLRIIHPESTSKQLKMKTLEEAMNQFLFFVFVSNEKNKNRKRPTIAIFIFVYLLAFNHTKVVLS